MIRSIISLTAVLFAQTVLAAPAVGDKAVYGGTYLGVAFVQTTELTSYDIEARIFTRVSTTETGEEKSTEQDMVAYRDVFSADKGAKLVSQCTQYGGTLKDIQIGSQVVTTCRVPNEENDLSGDDLFVGAVPFGVVRVRKQDLILDLIRWTVGE